MILGKRLAEYKYYYMAPVIEHAMAAAEEELKVWDTAHTRNTGVNDTPLEYAIENMPACAFDS